MAAVAPPEPPRADSVADRCSATGAMEDAGVDEAAGRGPDRARRLRRRLVPGGARAPRAGAARRGAAERDRRVVAPRPDHQPAGAAPAGRGLVPPPPRDRRRADRRAADRARACPRTGSTALSFLLAEDPDARSLRRWEAANALPAAVDGRRPRSAHRPGRRGGRRDAGRDGAAPRRARPVDADRARGVPGPHGARLPVALLPGASPTSRRTRRGCSTPTSPRPTRTSGGCSSCCSGASRPRPWRLKCPSHLLWLDALDRVFPDARFVMTHRDPTDVIVSVADVYGEVGRQFSDDVDLAYLGRAQRRPLVDRHGAAARVPGRRRRRPLLRHRLPATCSATRSARSAASTTGSDEPVTDEFEAGHARAGGSGTPRRGTRTSTPTPAAFGLDLDEVRARFADYTTACTAGRAR